MPIHIPVLLQEVITLTEPRSGEFVIDGTAGGGGHAEAFARAIGARGRLLCVDRDAGALARARTRLAEVKPETSFVHANYADIPDILKKKKLGAADILLLDLGFSSFQIENTERGFSFRTEDAPLDMRYDTESNEPTAADIVNGLPESELTDLLFEYGEERASRKIAKAIVTARRKGKLRTVGDLLEAIAPAFPPSRRRGKTHFATKTFQALRIQVNREFENLERAMQRLPEMLGSGGRAAVITFHSAEDRIVKRAFRGYADRKVATLITKKPVAPSRGEVLTNPRARSAKLRVLRFS